MKALVWRVAAELDTAEAARWFAGQGGLVLGERFLAAVEHVLALIVRHPRMGSASHANYVADLPAALRFQPVSGFERYLIYYIELPTHLEVIRVWNTARGLDALMSESSE